MFPRTKEELIERVKDHVRTYGAEPTVVWIPDGMERYMRAWTPNEVGAALAKRLRNGQRPKRILGMRACWGRPGFALATR